MSFPTTFTSCLLSPKDGPNNDMMSKKKYILLNNNLNNTFLFVKGTDPPLMKSMFECFLEKMVQVENFTVLSAMDVNFEGEHTCNLCPWWQEWINERQAITEDQNIRDLSGCAAAADQG